MKRLLLALAGLLLLMSPALAQDRVKSGQYFAAPADLVDGQWTSVLTDIKGRQFILFNSGWSYAAAASGIANTTTAVTIKTAAGAGIRNCITSFDLETDGALGAATEFVIRNGAAGTVLWRTKIGTAGLAVGRVVSMTTPLCGTANTLMEIATLTASVTGAVYFNAQGWTGP